MHIDQAFLETLTDFEAGKQRVRDALARTVGNETAQLRFVRQYAAWNSYFAAGVAQLVANIAGSVDLFMEDGQPYALADRSAYVASFIFDAARDEYDDHISRGRDPHRSLAQAMLAAMADRVPGGHAILDEREGYWLNWLIDRVVLEYDGYEAADDFEAIFYGIGFHLGSELLADQEFSIIDKFFREQSTDMFKHLRSSEIHLADADHRAYAWIGVHSGTDGGAEADHFAWALEGVNKGLDLLQAPKLLAAAALATGFRAFAQQHKQFFERVGE
jgi:hypothetical protein